MSTFKLIKDNKEKLLPLALASLNPANGMVLLRNFLSIYTGLNWEEYCNKKNKNHYDIVKKTLNWLTYSQDKVGSGGIGCYEFYKWTKGYPEVTGYIIPTFWDCYHLFKDDELKVRAIKMTDWELSIQKINGGWEGYYEGDNQPAVVFNTGQVIRGLVRTFKETAESKYLDAAIRAADWIVKNQDSDGSWTSANYKKMKRVYDTYVSAALAQLWEITNDEKYAQSAIRNCCFAISNQHENGWFDLCDNTLYYNQAPVTHTIAYTIDGLIETGQILKKDSFINAAKKSVINLLHKHEILSFLPARFDKNWKKKANYICNTGVAQIGIIFMRFYELENDPRYLNAALKMVDFLSYVQDLNGVGRNRKGGIPGSYPIWGMYCPFKYPSWAAKYFIDLVLFVKKHIE